MLLDEKYTLGPSSSLSRMRARDLLAEDRLVQMDASPVDLGSGQVLSDQDVHEDAQLTALHNIAMLARSKGVRSPCASLG